MPQSPCAPTTTSLPSHLPALPLTARLSPPFPPVAPLAQGAVALPPTELAVYDVEVAIADTELRLERFLAVREVGGLRYPRLPG